MAKQLSKAHIQNVFTVTLKQIEEDPIPISPLSQRIDEIAQKYLQEGYSHIDLTLVGHSLGALIATKWAWRTMPPEKVSISKVISIAGRLKYVENRFDWFCRDVRPEIETTYREICNHPNRVPLLTIWGDRDALVPKQSAHIQGETSRECTIPGWGHGGVVFAPKTHKQVVFWMQNKHV